MKNCPKCDSVLELDENNELYCPNEECPTFIITDDEDEFYDPEVYDPEEEDEEEEEDA